MEHEDSSSCNFILSLLAAVSAYFPKATLGLFLTGCACVYEALAVLLS